MPSEGQPPDHKPFDAAPPRRYTPSLPPPPGAQTELRPPSRVRTGGGDEPPDKVVTPRFPPLAVLGEDLNLKGEVTFLKLP